MFFKNLLHSGWLHALFIGVLGYPLGALSAKLIVSVFNSNILVYTSIILIGISASSLLRAGPGEFGIKTLKRSETWIYAIAQIAVILCGLLLMKYVSATEGAGLFRTTGLFTLILSGLLLSQKIVKFELTGALLILAGFGGIIYHADLEFEAKILLFIFVCSRAISQSTLQIIAELHKTNRAAKNYKDEIRITGFIMAVSGLSMLIILLIIAHIKTNHNLNIFSNFPSIKEFGDLKCFGLAIFMGMTIETISKYCEFYASKTIGAKYLTTLISLQVISVYFMEKILSFFNIMEMRPLSIEDFGLLSLILIGNILIALSGFFKDLKFIKKGEKQDTLANMDENILDSENDFKLVKLNLKNLMTLYDNDSGKLAIDIKLDKITIMNILQYELSDDIKITKKVAKIINEFANMHVTFKDKLTKAYNRYALTQHVESLLDNKTSFKLYLLDLNKFKYVNDTFGHDAGDFVLIQTVKRLKTLSEFNNKVYRLGGDEFVLIQTQDLDKDFKNLIIQTIEKPISYQDNSLEISTSIGTTLDSKNTTLDTILELADKNMYTNKNS